jgi:hypothetical protein
MVNYVCMGRRVPTKLFELSSNRAVVLATEKKFEFEDFIDDRGFELEVI